MPEFLLYALAGGMGVALIAGPLGCFVVWRRMAYFGDTLAHSALMGISLGLLLNINLNLAIALICIIIAMTLFLLQRQQALATDTLLGILAHSSLSIGLVMVSLSGNLQVDLNAYLFGDLLAITAADLWMIWLVVLLASALLWACWRPLLTMSIHEELARVEGVRVDLYRAVLMLLFSCVIAVAMKIVGVLLITALMIIPAATARRLSATPEAMAINASAVGMLSVSLGLALSWYADTPAGPSVVLCSFALFIASGVKALAKT